MASFLIRDTKGEAETGGIADMSQGRQESPRLEVAGGTPWTLVSGICSPEL